MKIDSLDDDLETVRRKLRELHDSDPALIERLRREVKDRVESLRDETAKTLQRLRKETKSATA